MPLLIIGGVTLDQLHFPIKKYPRGTPLPDIELAPHSSLTAGGAGMYTALAGTCAGSPTTLFAQHPTALPEILQPIATHLNWIGPQIPLADLPRLEIAHYGDGRASLLHAHWGAQAHLTPDALPPDLTAYTYIHLAVMVSAHRQLEFLRICRQRSSAFISAGSNGKTAWTETETVRALIHQTDLFFMNENEAKALYGSVEQAQAEPGKRLFITQAERGVLLLDHDTRTWLSAPSVEERDPTGAGDTFCGTTLAGLEQGLDPVTAAQHGVVMASEMIMGIGPEKLLLKIPRNRARVLPQLDNTIPRMQPLP